ncbi:MAG TPA: ATP-binding cassette domain-containing protein [Anaerolineales bacterium]|nr:ATP-binding cassette domain-containing protein [Anaerolineales bacterium]
MYNINSMLSRQRPTSLEATTRSLRRDLGLQLLALYLLFIIPVIVAALLFYFTSSSRLESDVKAADLSLARAIAHETNARLADAIYTVQQLSRRPSVRQVDVATMEVLFEDTANARPDVNLIYRLGSDGLMLFHYPLGPGSTLGVDFSYREYFQDALLTDLPVISKGRISPTTEQAVATTVMPIRNAAGDFLGVVATNIRLEMGGTNKRAQGKIEKNVEWVFDLFPRLKERENQRAGTLSGGEQQMLAVARGLMAEPEVLMFDELSLGLAPNLVLNLFGTLKKHKEQGLTMLLVEQNVHLALSISDFAYVLSEGHVILEGPAQDVAQDRMVQTAYLGI